MSDRTIYLDHNATTPLDPRVLAAMMPHLTGSFGNPSSAHRVGRAARRAVAAARETVAELLGVKDREVIFTASGTEADNLALRGVLAAAPKGKRHVVSCRTEHSAVLNCLRALRRKGAEVELLPVDADGLVDPDRVRGALRDDTALVSIHLVNNETGAIQPLAEIAATARERGIPVHTDAVQAAGKIGCRVDDLGVDLLSLSAHKVHGPKGVGLLIVRDGTPLEPIVFGGNQERQRRGGTENVAGIVGAAAALRLAVEEREQAGRHMGALAKRMHERITARINGVQCNGSAEQRVANTLNLSFDGTDGVALMHSLDLEGIAVSTGSACASGSPEPSHVLLAMGREPADAQSAIRFSLGRENTEDEIDTAADAVVAIVQRLRARKTF